MAFAQRHGVHVNRALLCQNLRRLHCLVVESHISTQVSQELNLFIRAGRCNDFEAVPLGELNDEARNSLSAIKSRWIAAQNYAYDPTAPAPLVTNATSPYAIRHVSYGGSAGAGQAHLLCM